jgi:hypothetical protein
MTLRIAFLSLLTIACLVLAVSPAMADTLYSNGPYNGTVDAWTINFGFSVTNSFTCSAQSCGVTDFSIVTWNIPGDSLLNLEMQLGNSSFGSQYSDQVLAPSGSVDLGSNLMGYELWEYEFIFPAVHIGNGINWITLSNANTTEIQPIYWDENSGINCPSLGCPSMAFENTIGSIASESFTITGYTNGGTTPEPSSILLFGSGILGLAVILRRRLMG